MAPSIAFVDFEASGLGALSWPVEVGWAYDHGAEEAHLIRPCAEWPMSAWDPAAGALHGLDVETLFRAGEPAGAVCDRMNEALEGVRLYSDAPAWDGYWLYRLFSAAGRRPRFQLQDFAALMEAAYDGDPSVLIAEAQWRAPRAHRAREDSRHLRAIYHLATGRMT